MASTINATTSGVVTTGDSVATLSLQTGGTTAVAIDTAQIVTLSKSLALLGSTSGSVALAAPATAGTQSYTLPTALPGTSGYALTSTTGGVMSWAAASATPAGSDTQVQYNSGGTAFAGSSNLTFNGTTLTAAGLAGPLNGTVGATTPNTGVFTTAKAIAAATQDAVQLQGRAGGTGSFAATITPTTLTASRTFTLPDATGTLLLSGGDLGTPSAGVVTNLTGTASININGTVGATTANTGTFSSTVHKGATSGTITLAAPAVAGTQSYTLPTAVPAANGYALTSTTAGVMSWASVAGGSAATPTALGTVYGNTASTNNAVALGYQAATTTPTASGVVAIGYQALQLNTGTNCTAVGYTALKSNVGGGPCEAFGYGALGAHTSGSYNVAVGASSLAAITSTSRNTAVGNSALTGATLANNNTAVGYNSLAGALTTDGSTAIGAYSLQVNTAAQNTGLGYYAGSGTTSGTSNTFVGSQAGSSLTTGSYNTIFGYNTNASAVGATGQIVIGGNSCTGQADNNVTIGSSSGKIYNAYTVNATWTQTSDGRLKNNINDDSLGLSFINRLRPVTFTWKASNEIDPSLPYYNETNQRDTTTVIHGLIAQEVKAALDAEGCSTFNGWDAGNEDTIQAISREMFISPLIKAIQELSAANEALTARIAALEAK